jgi:hypothetical protein
MLELASKVRKPTLAIVLWCIALFVLAGLTAGTEVCGGGPGVRPTCRHTGNPAWVGDLALGLWLLVLVGLIVLWFRTRPKVRICPSCRHKTRKRGSECTHCGGDLNAAVLAGNSSATGARVTMSRPR